MRISDWSSDVCSSDLKTWLDALHADAIAEKSQYQYMYTEGHWWSDRVDQPNETLQRERLGGIALKRNQTYPGNAVSWRFADPDGAVNRSEEHTSELPSLMRNSYAVFCLKKKKNTK